MTDDHLDGRHFGGREQVETDLSEALRAALTAQVVPALRERDGEFVSESLERVASSGLRAGARRFQNDATREVRRVRAKRSVRFFRLAGYADPPAGQLRRRCPRPCR